MMTIKKSELERLWFILSTIRATRLSNKDGLRLSFVKSFLALRTAANELKKGKDEIIAAFQKDWMSDMLKVQILRETGNPVEGFDEFLEAEADANKLLNEYLEGTIDVDFTPVPLDQFIEALNDTDEVAAESIGILCDNGILVS